MNGIDEITKLEILLLRNLHASTTDEINKTESISKIINMNETDELKRYLERIDKYRKKERKKEK